MTVLKMQIKLRYVKKQVTGVLPKLLKPDNVDYRVLSLDVPIVPVVLTAMMTDTNNCNNFHSLEARPSLTDK